MEDAEPGLFGPCHVLPACDHRRQMSPENLGPAVVRPHEDFDPNVG
jgi:hypothetical protein